MKLPKVGDYWIRIEPNDVDNKKLCYVVKVLNIFTNIENILCISYQYVSHKMYGDRPKQDFLQNFQKLSQLEYEKIINEDMIRDIIE
jgi:hypothetical protein